LARSDPDLARLNIGFDSPAAGPSTTSRSRWARPTTTTRRRAEEPVAALKELTHGQGVDLALDCSGVEAARAAAIRSTRTWGTVCLVGEGGSVTIDVSRDMIRKQLTVIGSWTFSSVIQAECARFVVDRAIDVERLFTQRYALDQADEAYRLFDTQTTGKGVFLL
jgi:threonine dehydrogenase-like Zn-dependent dehydrogenase